MKIIIDADACPRSILAICKELGKKYGVMVWTVASFHHVIDSELHVVVGGDSQEADIKVLNMTEAGDVVITQDWGLAAMILGRSAYVIGTTGREYIRENIEFLLEERAVKEKFRKSGGRTKGPARRTQLDDAKFRSELLRVLERSIVKNNESGEGKQ